MIKKCSMIEIRFQTFTPVQKQTWHRQPGRLPMWGKLEGLHSKPWCWIERRYRNTPVITSSDFHQRLNDHWKSPLEPGQAAHCIEPAATTRPSRGQSLGRNAFWPRHIHGKLRTRTQELHQVASWFHSCSSRHVQRVTRKMNAALLDHTPNLIR